VNQWDIARKRKFQKENQNYDKKTEKVQKSRDEKADRKKITLQPGE